MNPETTTLPPHGVTPAPTPESASIEAADLNAKTDADGSKTPEATPEVASVAAPRVAATVTVSRPVTPGTSQSKPAKRKSPGTSQKNGAHDGVTRAGAVTIENEDVLRAVPLFYYAERGQWFSADGRGNFTKISDSQAKSYVALYGYNKSIKDSDGNTKAERAMLWLMHNKKVAFAGAVAGYPAGVHESGGISFLVTESPVVIEPKIGKCATIRQLVESQFFDATAEDTHRQIVCFYLWASESFRAFYGRISESDTNNFRHCPALVIFGPRGCGKTALIDLILAPLFGGKKADPMNYLRDPKFNKDLFGASLLNLDDKGASANLAERRQRGEGIKDLIWKPEQRMEGKGADAVNLRPFWRLVIAGNDDDGGLQVCPALTESLEDKLLILRATQAEGLPATHEENDAWAKQIRAELPAFAAYLPKQARINLMGESLCASVNQTVAEKTSRGNALDAAINSQSAKGRKRKCYRQLSPVAYSAANHHGQRAEKKAKCDAR